MSTEQTPTPPLLNPTTESQIFYWCRRLLACNPFYLISAACLLYGMYQLTIDPTFRGEEHRQLATIFGSLQFYEVLLVSTAIFLAWRKIWYDSTLLVVLETMLVLVPFILVTLAVFMGNPVAWIVCGTGAGLAVVKFWSLKRFIRELNLTERLLAIGLVVLLVNLAAPFRFRIVHMDSLAHVTAYSRIGWLVVLPLLLGLANGLRRPTGWGEVAAQRSWLPLLITAIWLTASAVHLYCLGYIYDLVWQPSFLAPLLWVASWTMFNRLGDFANRPTDQLRTFLSILPVFTPLLGAWDGNSQIVLWLAGLNAAIYATVYFNRRDNRTVFHLLTISLTTALAAMPESIRQALLPSFSRGACVMGVILGYIIFRSLLSRSPKLALAGALATTCAVNGLLRDIWHTPQLGIQAGLAFLLIHSFRWVDQEHSGAAGLRIFAAIAWVAHTFAAVDETAASSGWTVTLLAALVLGCFFVAWLIRSAWPPKVIPAAAFLVMLVMPAKSIPLSKFTVPSGLFSILLAFILFGLGTFIALMRSRWDRSGK